MRGDLRVAPHTSLKPRTTTPLHEKSLQQDSEERQAQDLPDAARCPLPFRDRRLRGLRRRQGRLLDRGLALEPDRQPGAVGDLHRDPHAGERLRRPAHPERERPSERCDRKLEARRRDQHERRAPEPEQRDAHYSNRLEHADGHDQPRRDGNQRQAVAHHRHHARRAGRGPAELHAQRLSGKSDGLPERLGELRRDDHPVGRLQRAGRVQRERAPEGCDRDVDPQQHLGQRRDPSRQHEQQHPDRQLHAHDHG